MSYYDYSTVHQTDRSDQTDLSDSQPSETALEQYLGFSLVEDLNAQLATIASQLQDELNQKQSLRDEIAVLNTHLAQSGLTDEEKESLTAQLENKQEELAQLNSNSELTMIQVQSLMDQRKNAMTLLSNLISANNSTKQSIIQNMKM
jgi:chromosome segregation ATPase